MIRKLNRSPEEMARREKISEMLQALDISSMDDIKELYRQTIAQFMENSLGSEPDESLGYERYDQAKKDTENSRNGYSKKTLKTVSEMQKSLCPGIGKASSIRRS